MVIRELLRNQQKLFAAEHVQEVTEKLLLQVGKRTKETSTLVLSILDELPSLVDASAGLKAAATMATRESSFQPALQLLSKFAQKLSPAGLLQQIPQVLPPLFQLFGHANAEVRKAVVFCLVDLYVQLGDDFVPFLAQLSSSKAGLVHIYYRRRLQQSQQLQQK
jgi:CLIP-associating protein 1/2